MSKSNYYVKNKDLLIEIKNYKKTGKYNNTLGSMIMLIVTGLAHRPNFYNYTYIDDMKSEAYIAILKGLKNYDAEKYNNPFGFINKCAWNAFIMVIKKEKKKAKTKSILYDKQHEFTQTKDYLTGINYAPYNESN